MSPLLPQKRANHELLKNLKDGSGRDEALKRRNGAVRPELGMRPKAGTRTGHGTACRAESEREA